LCATQPLTPSDAKPDMAMLRLIKESELRRGTIIGSGAFGTVYRVRVGHSCEKYRLYSAVFSASANEQVNILRYVSHCSVFWTKLIS